MLKVICASPPPPPPPHLSLPARLLMSAGVEQTSGFPMMSATQQRIVCFSSPCFSFHPFHSFHPFLDYSPPESSAFVQVLREAQTKAQQSPPPPGSSSPQKDNGLGPPGAAARKEFEASLALYWPHLADSIPLQYMFWPARPRICDSAAFSIAESPSLACTYSQLTDDDWQRHVALLSLFLHTTQAYKLAVCISPSVLHQHPLAPPNA